jgi:hypothetical protein
MQGNLIIAPVGLFIVIRPRKNPTKSYANLSCSFQAELTRSVSHRNELYHILSDRCVKYFNIALIHFQECRT